LREEAAERPDEFWARQAEALPWFRGWDRVFEWERPTFRWFVGGETNLAHNCLDRNVEAGAGDRTALMAVNERGDRHSLTYAELLAEVERVAEAA
jgi:acetyl-CoA synthetase